MPNSRDPMDCSRQAPLFVGFSWQEYWSELPFPSPGDLPDPRDILKLIPHCLEFSGFMKI